jgi:hypothetical protein
MVIGVRRVGFMRTRKDVVMIRVCSVRIPKRNNYVRPAVVVIVAAIISGASSSMSSCSQ